ncbi:MAG: A/G-specific adenine glycosylase [Clostridia bacterium]
MQPAPLLLAWYDRVKRDLPWRSSKNPYRIWISEIMLQQTRVETVKGYYARFLALFPTIEALAQAPQEQVLKAWEGLGYYSRARNLQKAAKLMLAEFGGEFPHSYDEMLKLSGIGPYTAGAVASIAFDERVPAIDGNVYRVAARFFGVRDDIGAPATQRQIRALVFESLPPARVGDYNQALMELGATLCAPAMPACDLCPWFALCNAAHEGDAELLPIHEKKRPPKLVDVAVCLLTYDGKVLVVRRDQRMLRGLYVFWLIEEETDPIRVRELLSEAGLSCGACVPLGSARHVFTHRVWEMQLLRFPLTQAPKEQWLAEHHAHFASPQELSALPLPTAMKAAKAAAMAAADGEG